jgi:tRNA(Ile)-lysidine synthase
VACILTNNNRYSQHATHHFNQKAKIQSAKFLEMPMNIPDSSMAGVWKHGIVTAVSGGADSVAMLRFLEQRSPAKTQLTVCHVNHRLRGEESDADAEFVRNLAAKFQLRYVEHRMENNSKWSEDAARKRRYNFLVQTTEQIGFRYLATAHTANDQTETVLHRIIRGTGLTGLAGMIPMRQITPAVTLIRPFLNVHRQEILDYLDSLGQSFCHDSTNNENDYTRNKIRNQLLPTLREMFNPKIDDAVCRLSYLAKENGEVLDELIGKILDQSVLRKTENEILIDSAKLQNYSPATLREVFVRLWKDACFPQRDMDLEHWESLVEFFRSQLGHREFPASIAAEHLDGQFRLFR